MGTRFNSSTIKERTEQIIQSLEKKGFVIQRYDSTSTNSIYLKLDYGVCNSIRISDHEGKKHLCYRYNIIIGCEDNIIEEKYMRYYFNESNVAGLINQILFDKTIKLEKYGKQLYQHYMVKNMNEHKNDNGFWKDAKVVAGDKTYVDPNTGNIVHKIELKKSCIKPNNPIKLIQMPDGTYACGPSAALNFFEKVVADSIQLNLNAKFQQDETLKVIASYAELEAYYMTTGETDRQAKTHALQVLGKPGYNIGTNLGATKCEEGMFYTLELPLVPMEFLPEKFLDRT